MVERGGGANPESRTLSRHPWPKYLGVALLIGIFGTGAGIYWHRARADPRTPSAEGKNKQGAGAEEGAAVPVIAVRAGRGNIGVYDTGLGAVTAIYTDTITSRVDGELISVLYHEGQMVQKGDLLMELDPRPYQAALTQAEGELARDQASLDNARIDLARYELLIKTNAIPEQQLATQRALVAQDEGALKFDQGQVDSARVNLIYTKITAPISGRVGLRLVDPGNIVRAAETTPLVVITQIDPISVIFTLAEDQLPQVYQKLRAGQMLEVDAYDRAMQKKMAQGTLTTIDNQIDQTTGTIRLRATFDNKNNALFPNQFVNAKLLVEEKRNVVLINSAAIQRTSSSTFVYLVKPDSTVTVRNVMVDTTEGSDAEITSGLTQGDVVVMTGADKLQEGTRVSVQFSGEPSGSQK